MAGQPPTTQQNTYEDLMNTGHAAAWDQNWELAIHAYTKAIKSKPTNPVAYNSLGLALIQVQPPRLQQALQVYQKAHDLDPDDPLPLEKSADVYERMGRLQDAAKQYLNVADAYLSRNDLEKAIGNWERATRVTPGLVRIHQKLAVAYERIGDKKQAVREYLTLAANFQRQNKTQIAIQAVERALRLEPRNPQALNMLQALRSGGELIYADERLRGRDVDARPEGTGGLEDPTDVAEANADGPLGDAVELALEKMANTIGDLDLMANPGAMQILQAMEMHRIGSDKPALEAYRQAFAAGVDNTAIKLAMGELFVKSGQYKQAIKMFDAALQDKDLAAGAHHGLGIAHRELGNVHDATRHLVRTMQHVDIGMAVDATEAGQLDAVYDRLLHNAKSADKVALENLNSRFFDMLTGTDWKQRVEVTRHQLEDAMDEPEAILDVASVSPEVVESINNIDRYIAQRRFILAMDEAFFIIEHEPDFLAAHLRVGQIQVAMGDLDRAIEKYRQIAETYLARGNKARAREIFNEIIGVAPMDTRLRQDLIYLLEEDERWEEIVEQYISLSNAYAELGDLSNARTTLKQTIQIGQRVGVDNSQIVAVFHRLADIELMRLDQRQALRAYESIKNIDPSDQKAREMLITLNFQMNDPTGAISELDGLLRLYAQRRDGKSILQLLEHWAQERPQEDGIRMRLASVYEQLKRPDKALTLLRKLLSKQLDNNRSNEACKIIKRILALKPPDSNRFVELARQIGCG
jgi:tetratricopeptide (TPR) repeat protein